MKWFRRNKKKPEKGDDIKVAPQAPAPRYLSYEAANLQGIGRRRRQEDAFAFVNVLDVTEIQKNGLLFMVADGMGGMKDGSLASGTVIAGMKECFSRMDRSGDLALQLRDSVFQVGEKVLQVLGGDGGSTLVACIVFQEELYFASVGDSFLYLARGGQLFRLNREHTLQQQTYMESIRRGIINPSKVDVGPEAPALTQFMGMNGMSEVDYFRVPLPVQDGDVFLVCSDGVGGVLSEQTILSCITSESPQDACQAMEREIIAQGRTNQDNYTALVVKCVY
ncbi:MAG: serine/threonine-protein phosphatase [Lachnospiraceae bacterium]|nr:serine/threonine-protein phosphatase [Lachnospiraceae bacterium]